MLLLSTLSLALAVLCAVAGIVLMMAMAGAVEARGETVYWPLIRLYMLRHIHRYRVLTTQESGRPGPLFYPFLIVMNSALAFTILGLVLRAV